MQIIETPQICKPWQDYALLDSGSGRKLERYGKVIVSRPDPQALWQPNTPTEHWQSDATFSTKNEAQERGAWDMSGRADKTRLPPFWHMSWHEISFHARLSPFRHMGVFPEHTVHWQYAQQTLRNNGGGRVLNLFGYTGLASLACAAAGAEVTHCDASPQSVNYAKENQTLSQLDNRPMRWIVDDAQKFLAREIRRGRQYEGVILDPPKFGRGPKNERWEFASMMPNLLAQTRAIMSKEPLFVILTSYAVRLSYISLAQMFSDHFSDLGGALETGEMFIAQSPAPESGNHSTRQRKLPMALYARWSAPGK